MIRTLTWICFAVLLASAPASFAGEDMKLKARLIWGCDDVSNDPKITPVDPEVAKQLKGIFKWKHYYVVTNMTAKVSDKATSKFVLSEKCTVEVKNEAHKYEAKLFGEGKHLKTLEQKKVVGENLVLAGDAKDATAWFVILTPEK